MLEIVQEMLPEEGITELCLNKNVVCSPHKDKSNFGPSYILFLCEFEGGALVLEEIRKRYEKKEVWHGPFLGSEFSFEDFSFQEVEKYEYQYIRDEEYEGMLCHVIERIPLDPYSGYTKQIVWIDTEYFLIRKIHHFDRKSFHLKTQLFLDYEIYDEAYWQPHRVVMNNNQNGKSSILSFKEVKYKNGLTDRDFSQNSLKRSR